MEWYKNYEYWIDNKCRYGLSVSVNSCRQCLFNTLCHLEKDKQEKSEKESDLSTNK